MNPQSLKEALGQIIADESELNSRSFEELFAAAPRVDSLADLPSGTSVLVRADVDVAVKDGVVKEIARLEADVPTLRFGQERGWTTIVLGHIGRKKEASLQPVAEAFNQRFGFNFHFIPDWLDEEKNALKDSVVDLIKAAPPGRQFLLENTRRYDIERALWKASPQDLEPISARMSAVGQDIRQRLAKVFINEAIAASNLDFSSCVIPLFMDRTAYGYYIFSEFKDHLVRVRDADLVVFSGLKIDKLDDLEGIVDRGKLRLIIAAGSLAMALRKAKAQREGTDFGLGRAESDPQYAAYISPERIAQARRILGKCDQFKVEVVLPVDYILEDGAVSATIPPHGAQMDIGPQTRAMIESTIQKYIGSSRHNQTPIMFYNGVFGKFEDPAFSRGTQEFIPLLKQMTQAGVQTFVGGGEGRAALERFGSLDDVTHAFTCGGTVLKSLTNRHIGFLKAMFLQKSLKSYQGL